MTDPTEISRDILATANSLIHGDRQEDYGSAENSFGLIATLWNAYLGTHKRITAHDVAMMMLLLKAARAAEGTPKQDTYVDMAGYAALAGRLSL